jgi:hypothetical protein
MFKAQEQPHPESPMKSTATHHRSKSTAKAGNSHTTHPVPSTLAFKPSAEAVAIRAYQNFEINGAIHGHDVEHWLTAEAALQAEQGHTHT